MVEEFRYLETTLTDQHPIHEEIRSTLKSGNAYCHLVQNPESFVFHLAIQKHEDIRDCNAAVLYGCETWSFTLRDERRLRVFENRVLGRKFGPKREEVTEKRRKLHNEELNDLYPHSILFG